MKAKLSVVFMLGVAGAAQAELKSELFTFEQAAEEAALLANAPYKEWIKETPKGQKSLTYDEYRDIRFNPKKAVWRYDHIPFQVQLFHPGWIQSDQIDVHAISGGRVDHLAYDSHYFTFGTNVLAEPNENQLKFSGFRIHYPLNRPDYLDELAVFQGATYFRCLAQNLVYGLSARTVAVNCGGPGAEEFPRFRAFWLVRPRENEKQVKLFGIFDGPSLAGAAEFMITPGTTTRVHCRVSVYARTHLAHLGIAPLTSMFWYGKSCGRSFSDFRPEVHDSDGLLMHNGVGEWLWRPLANEARLRLCSFMDQNPKGFGLIQRDRSFATYEDLEAHYQDRPSAWVTPEGDWGPGSVKLLEIPTPNEFNDNIVAYWEPTLPLEAGQGREFAYTIDWYGENLELPALGRVRATRLADLPDTEDLPLVQDGKTVIRKFVLDFAWPGIEDAAKRANCVAEVFPNSNAELVHTPVQQYNAFDRTWRVFFKVKAPKDGQPVELRAFVLRDKKPVTETWIYLWNP